METVADGEATPAETIEAVPSDPEIAALAEEFFTTSEDDFAAQLAEVAKFERNVADFARSSGPHDIESAARRNRVGGPGASGGEWKGWLALAACLTLMIGGSYEYRHDIVDTFPATAPIYEAIGLPVNVRGMEFANVAVTREFDNGLPVLAVRGEIVNISERMLDVPRVRFGLRDRSETEIYHWTMATVAEPLAPKSRTRFTTKLAAPPKEAHDVVVRFHDLSDLQAELAL